MDTAQASQSFKDLITPLKGKKVAILGHLRPDGDCIGSQVALTRTLNALGSEATLILDDTLPKSLQPFLGDTPLANARDFDHTDHTAIAVDCGAISRIGGKLDATYPEIFLNIDHHRSNSNFAKNNLVHPNAAATAEILAEYFLHNNFPIDATTAQALYIGITTDTGQFTYPSTTARTLELGKELITLGANPTTAARHLYESEPAEKLFLLREFLGSLKLELSGKLCIGFVTKEMFENTGTSKEHTEGFVDFARSIDGVEIGILLEERDEGLKGSLRAKDPKTRLDILAESLNGGGHACAAGIRTLDPIETFYPKLIQAVQDHLNKIED